MTKARTGRRRYYNIFSHFYDAFIKMHSRQDDGTRGTLVHAAHLSGKREPRILDVCCGTGSVILTFKEHYPDSFAVGYDFSPGMLRMAKAKDTEGGVFFMEGDAAKLPFEDNSFDVVTCSHALYELKGETRQKALEEMKRVVRPFGYVLLMEHEVPTHPVVKLLFNLRMLAMGSSDAQEFVAGGLEPFRKVFSTVHLSHSRTGRSKLISCQK